MKKQNLIYTIIMGLGFVSMLFVLGLYFFLPHQFLEAVPYYISLAPTIRNYYCFSLLVSGLVGIFSMTILLPNMRRQYASIGLVVMIAFNIIFGLLIYPSVDLIFQTQSGINQDNINVYRDALRAISLYLDMHVAMACFSGFCLFVKEPTKKDTIGLALMFATLGTIFTVFIYQQYYDHEEVALMDNVEYQFVGVNGKGSLEVISNDHPIKDIFPNFMNTLTYEVLNNGTLSNGEQVAMTGLYDTKMAKDLHLDVINAVKTVEVSGLREFYSEYSQIPTKIVEEARLVSDNLVHLRLSEVLPGRETKVQLIEGYYVQDNDLNMDSIHALVWLYRISYTYENQTYYFYRACQVDEIHSDALKNLEVLEAKINQDTYRSALCIQTKNDISEQEAKMSVQATLTNQFDLVEEIMLNSY